MTQQDFQDSLDRVSRYLFEHEDEGGYAGSYVHGSQRRMDLYWKGPLPDPVVALLQEVKHDCPVQVLAAAHDVVELRQARDRITSDPDVWSSGIVTIAFATDGSGLELGYDSEEPPTQFVERLSLDVPFSWEPDSAPEPALLHLQPPGAASAGGEGEAEGPTRRG